MYVIDNISPKAPKFVYTPPPPLITRYDEDAYWDEEVRRWNEGYQGLTGFHYFYLTQWWLQDNITFKPIRPRWREDDDNLVFQKLDLALRTGHDFLELKRREAAWSSILSALFVWQGLINTGSVMGYTSADVDRIMKFYEQKLDYGILRLSETLPEHIFNFRYHIKNSKMGSNLRMWDNKSKEYSVIDGYETVKDPKAFEGQRYKIIGLDEIAIHGKIDEVWGSADSSRMAGLRRAGLILAGGTAGTIKHESRQLLLNKCKNSEQLKIVVTYVLGYHAIDEMDMPDGSIVKITENGYTNHKLAKECIEKMREVLWKTGDMVAYWEKFYALPLHEDEIFMATDKSNLPEDIAMGLQQQNKVIIMNERDRGGVNSPKELFERGRVRLDDKSIPSFNAHPTGRIYVVNPPKNNNVYIAGTDPIPVNSSNTEGSNCVMAIKNKELQTYDAFYIGRFDDAKTIASEMIALQVWYNNAVNMMETDRGSAIMSAYKDLNRLDLLADSPYMLGIKFSRQPNNKGFKAGAFGNLGDSYLLEYLKYHSEKIFFKPIIEQAFLWGTKANLDIMDGMRACELYDKNMVKLETKKNVNNNVEYQYQAVVNGQLVILTAKHHSSLQ